MMAHLDVLKFTPSPKKGSLDSGIFGNGLGMGIVRMCYMEMGSELATTPFHGRTNCVFLFGWTISSLVKLTLHFPRSCLVSPVALGSLLVFIFIISMYFSFLFFFWEIVKTLGRKNKKWSSLFVFFVIYAESPPLFFPFSRFLFYPPFPWSGNCAALCDLILFHVLLLLWEIVSVSPYVLFFPMGQASCEYVEFNVFSPFNFLLSPFCFMCLKFFIFQGDFLV